MPLERAHRVKCSAVLCGLLRHQGLVRPLQYDDAEVTSEMMGGGDADGGGAGSGGAAGSAGSDSAGSGHGGLTLMRLLVGAAAVCLSYWTSDIMGPTDPAELAEYHAAVGGRGDPTGSLENLAALGALAAFGLLGLVRCVRPSVRSLVRPSIRSAPSVAVLWWHSL
eukprot:SAG22_NODE_3726_length_1558_cov_1.088417_2_plen_166_part_00